MDEWSGRAYMQIGSLTFGADTFDCAENDERIRHTLVMLILLVLPRVCHFTAYSDSEHVLGDPSMGGRRANFVILYMRFFENLSFVHRATFARGSSQKVIREVGKPLVVRED